MAAHGAAASLLRLSYLCRTVTSMRDPRDTMLTVRLPRMLVHAIDRRAERERVNRSEMVRRLLGGALPEAGTTEGLVRRCLNQLQVLRRELADLRAGRDRR
jgi:Arc/MetJ-type ribon-helix-helix transcriptional regulator